MHGEAKVQANHSATFCSRAGHGGRPGPPDQQPSNTDVCRHHPLRRKWNIHLSQKYVFRTGKHKSCFLTRIGIMSIWESEMQSIMLFDYWCFSHTTSFLRATVKKQNCVTWTSVSGETLPSKQAIV